uniref:Retroviral polymerase SH3-like domain-containing protein n=1 Tax=Physcomitrium patens TaxID=3218 RepID=A0A2K1JXQ1_PHYPA|nr:hypothetical protein PHYPA_013422 [Physcomitrium patens]
MKASPLDSGTLSSTTMMEQEAEVTSIEANNTVSKTALTPQEKEILRRQRTRINELPTDTIIVHMIFKILLEKYETFVRMLRVDKVTPLLSSLATKLHMEELEMKLSTKIWKPLTSVNGNGKSKLNMSEQKLSKVQTPRLPTKINNFNMLLEEAFSRIISKLHHMKTFGCLSNVHIGHQSRNKLQSWSIISTFVEYKEYSKEYRIFLYHLKKIIVIRDVIFEEKKNYRLLQTSR